MTQPPTKQQISAVRAVLYDHQNVTSLQGDIQSINVLFNHTDGSPFQWTYPDTGTVTDDVIQAAQFARSVAKTLTKMSGQIGDLDDIPSDDQHHLVAALIAEAAAWTARSTAWLSNEVSSDATAQQAQTIHNHEVDVATAAKKVRAYFKQTDPVNRG